MSRTCLSVILAAGEGTRMRSTRAKVLHEIAGLPMVAHAARVAEAAGSTAVAVVTGRDADAVEGVVRQAMPAAETFVQAERLGTAHAVLAAREAITRGFDDVLVQFGDTPLVLPETLMRARAVLAEGAEVCVVGFRTAEPTGYGRLIEKDGAVVAIREEKDASAAERAITFCNGGIMAIRGASALALLDAVGNRNAKGEYYLTDVVEIACARGATVRAIEAGADEVLGVNTRVELAAVEGIWQERRRRAAMLGGATLMAPETVFFAHDTQLGLDVIVEPNVVFGPGVAVADGATIHAFSHLEGARLASGATIGPYARLRPGTEIAERAKVGNFVETKNARIERGAKVNHLTYIGDARVGADANIGAGTITCNYDGANKWFTDIGANVFVGSNSSLVAPLAIGDGAYIGSGSVVTQDVPAEALAIGRSRQVNKDGYGSRLRERAAAIKASKNAKN
ncbi:bifunctional UDP-N-acetylglucosamine diphosphorylase/glucosamine-1-phosphate N-acetyltransferase GlmU [Aureimonas leprariae]|uniref:Bifunctional protein GlmU n=1 Tax=Plantimonas leprariae TaxID=2615207 RepID=A0A7V7PRX2_9HYPH|nr:bifunctional UDP-N-acetylglucosamine diphosphorylase/glucosamine-1-phosphate N-acetyltransferase GlmU [Aureimonas leprariae]KAB0681736.1 bifunctional UDP-N-acetylglucosamine diphosphorylase/glucosamine-1-phosphate N-acetyltransferase GlmU [Aureimonas leprariae]